MHVDTAHAPTPQPQATETLVSATAVLAALVAGDRTKAELAFRFGIDLHPVLGISLALSAVLNKLHCDGLLCMHVEDGTWHYVPTSKGRAAAAGAVRDALAALHQPIRGTAQLDADGTLTVGVYADGSPARWALTSAGRARHALIAGGVGSGTSCLLRSVLDGAAAAGASTQLIDLTDAAPTDSIHPTVTGIDATRDVLPMLVDLVHARLLAKRRGDGAEQPLLVLAVDGLHKLGADQQCVDQLLTLLRHATKARIAVLAATPDITLAGIGFGGDLVRSTLAADTVVLLRTDSRHAPRGITANAAALADQPAGVGFLPRQRPGMPFRAWLP